MKHTQNLPLRPVISCVWVETGNPKLPLACRWAVDEAALLRRAPDALELHPRQIERHPLCA